MGAIAGIWAFVILMTIVVLAITWIWIVVQAFTEHFLWGLAVLFVPMAHIVFVALNWSKSSRPFLLGLAATAALVIELLLAGGVSALFGG